ncbi:MAG: UDP-N-acetylmuramoyl-L-alanyl-D-glutamate--2,6-diaminopimelate ligase, partial [Clostridia bacterium]|nr:UDP-N-acetylmuramoyl-L-alanyl-D-glutamate--2,6-diaminopimelate ligase [Clostridia bacterium]
MLIKEFLNGNIRLINGNENISVSSLTIDSRKCTEGSLYFAINGTQVDGHKFVPQAYENGAVCAVVERAVDCPIPQIIVENTRSAMSYMASKFFGEPSKKLKMLGITGTNGKTSISYMIKAIAKENGISVGVIGTGGIWLNDERLDIKILTATTPDPIELQYALSVMAEKGAEWVVMEVTAHALDLNKVDGMEFISAGFTNLTQDHLEYFITMENYSQAKAKFFEETISKNAVLNIDDEFGKGLTNIKIPYLTYSVKERADLWAKNIEIGAISSSFTLEYKGNEYPV